MDDPLDTRLIALESRLAHHERMVEELSELVAGQAALLDRQGAEIRRLKERLRDLEAGWDGSSQDEKPPPHY